MTTMTYAGIGELRTSPIVLADMRRMARCRRATAGNSRPVAPTGPTGTSPGGTPPERRSLWLPWSDVSGYFRLNRLDGYAPCEHPAIGSSRRTEDRDRTSKRIEAATRQTFRKETMSRESPINIHTRRKLTESRQTGRLTEACAHL